MRRLLALAPALALAAVLLASCSDDDDSADGGPQAGSGVTVSSPDFDNGDPIPVRFSCEGDNVAPTLRFDGLPAGTAEVAITMVDPDAPSGTFVHWIVTGLPGLPTTITRGELPAGAAVHPGSSELDAYVGPCPPEGGGTHRYRFEVHALRSAPSLPASATPLDKVAQLRQEALATGRLEGTFKR